MIYIKKKGSELTLKEVNEIKKLLEIQGEVRIDTNRIVKVFLWVLAKEGNNLVGIGAIKMQCYSYIEKIKNNTGYVELTNSYKEIGYFSILEIFRNKGIGKEILKILIKNNKFSLYATTRNKIMSNILEKNGFILSGSKYKTDKNKDYLSLYTKKQ